MQSAKLTFLLLLSGIFLMPITSQALEDQSFDVLNYHIALSPEIANKKIQGYTKVTFQANRNDLEELNLMLQDFTIDSVTQHNANASLTNYNDTVMTIQLGRKLNQGDKDSLKIYYQGKPPKDPSSWGGFYFNNDFAFNLGVGFFAKPHNFGRAWFPCKDNFKERATYSFAITTDPDKKAFCNGHLADSVYKNGSITWHYKMEQSIPSYLASMVVGDYSTVKLEHSTGMGTIPIVYGVQGSDTSTMKQSFRNIQDGIDAFVEHYGPHQFGKVGFIEVPFTNGAMEHATNIAYPTDAVDGTLNQETLWAHELSHHWWGNLVTCSSAEEMWINEGWASYSENLFLEYTYGKERYREAVLDNHDQVLYRAHLRDDGFRALSPIPHDYTYGSHSYNKGADVAHTLRAYLGDSLFFDGINMFLQKNAFDHASSKDLRDSLTKYTGKDLTDFFDQWVFNPGFPHFAIQQWQAKKDANWYEITGTIEQKLRHAPEYYTDVPLTVTFFNDERATMTRKVNASGKQTDFNFSLPADFEPTIALLDRFNQISDAQSTIEKTIGSTGTYDMDEGRMELSVNEISDSAKVIMHHHWVHAGPFKGNNPGIKLHDYRYWTIKGLFPKNLEMEGQISYSENQKLDHTLNIQNEDSLMLMYRSNPAENWQEYEHYTVKPLNTTDGNGFINLSKVKLGDYCLGVQDDDATGLDDADQNENDGSSFNIYPNPTKDGFYIEPGNQALTALRLFNLSGQLLKEEKPHQIQSRIFWDTSDYKHGSYIIGIYQKETTPVFKQIQIHK